MGDPGCVKPQLPHSAPTPSIKSHSFWGKVCKPPAPWTQLFTSVGQEHRAWSRIRPKPCFPSALLDQGPVVLDGLSGRMTQAMGWEVRVPLQQNMGTVLCLAQEIPGRWLLQVESFSPSNPTLLYPRCSGVSSWFIESDVLDTPRSHPQLLYTAMV